MQGDDKGRLGEEGEQLVRSWLINQGYSILPASLIANMGAPMLLGKECFILPDNLGWCKGEPGWVEVKTKSHASHHELKPKRDEHGIKFYHWVAYEMVQMHTQIPVSLAILQIDIQSIGLSLIDNLKKGERVYPMQGEWHIFFDCNDFIWHSVDNLPMPKPIKPTAMRTINQLLKEREAVYARQRLLYQSE